MQIAQNNAKTTSNAQEYLKIAHLSEKSQENMAKIVLQGAFFLSLGPISMAQGALKFTK